MLYAIFVVAITAEAMTAALAAGRRQMDWFGVCVLAVVTALGGGTAILERGLLRVTGRGEPPAPLPELGLPEARILLWTVQQGADIDHTLLPLR